MLDYGKPSCDDKNKDLVTLTPGGPSSWNQRQSHHPLLQQQHPQHLQGKGRALVTSGKEDGVEKT